MTRGARRSAVAAAVLASGLALGACSAGGTSHVVRGTTGAVVPAGGSTPTPTSAPAATTGSPAGSAAGVAAPGTPLDSQTLSQVDAELGALNSGLSQANSDLSDSQGDS